MIPLVASSVVSLTVIIERFFFWRRLRKREHDTIILQCVEARNVDQAQQLAQESRYPVARVLLAGLAYRQLSPSTAMAAATQVKLRRVKLWSYIFTFKAYARSRNPPPARFLQDFNILYKPVTDGAGHLRYSCQVKGIGIRRGNPQGALMVTHILVILLSLGVLSTVNGCYFDPSLYDSRPSYDESGVGPYQGQPYREGRSMNEEERQYRRQRRAQELEQERAYQQQEQERQRDARPDWIR